MSTCLPSAGRALLLASRHSTELKASTYDRLLLPALSLSRPCTPVTRCLQADPALND